MEKAEAEKLQVVMAAQGDAEAKYLQGQVWPSSHAQTRSAYAVLCGVIVRQPPENLKGSGESAAPVRTPAPVAILLQGVARQRKAIVDGLRDSVVGFQSGVSDVSSRDVRPHACLGAAPLMDNSPVCFNHKCTAHRAPCHHPIAGLEL